MEGKIRKAIVCLENAIRQSKVCEVKARLCLGAILLKHNPNSDEAEAHIKRVQLLLESTPCFELKCRAYSLLSQYYHLTRATSSQSPKQFLYKGLKLTETSADRFAGRIWFCNFNSQLANVLMMEGDYQGSITALEQGYSCAEEICYPELQVFFASSVLHVHLMQRDDIRLVRKAFKRCNRVWKSLETAKAQQCTGLRFYIDLLHVFYQMRTHNHESAAQNVKKLDSAMKSDIEWSGQVQVLRKEFEVPYDSLSRDDLGYRDRSTLKRKRGELEKQCADYTGQVSANKDCLEPACFGDTSRACCDKLKLAPPPIDGQWLPERAVFSLLELLGIVFSRPKGLLERKKSIQTRMQTIREVDLEHSNIWMAGVYFTHLMHFLENKVAVDLTWSGFADAQLGLLQMGNRKILEACESTIKMLRSQYAHSAGCYPEATSHFHEASKVIYADDEIDVDLNERIKRPKTSRTSLFAISCNGDVVFGADGQSTCVFGIPSEKASEKIFELAIDVFVLGSGNRGNLVRVYKGMRRLANTNKFSHVKEFAMELANCANKARLFKEEDKIKIILIGRSSIQEAAEIYSVCCKSQEKVKKYRWAAHDFVFGGSGTSFMSFFKDRADQQKRFNRIRSQATNVDYLENLTNFVKDVIAEARRWDYNTDRRMHIMAMRKGHDAVHRKAKPLEKRNCFSGYGPLQTTSRRPLEP